MKNIVFGLYDVLIKGNLDINIDTSYLKELSTFAKENKINLYLVTGLKKDIGEKIIADNNLLDYFKEDNIIYISEDYHSYLSDLDLKLRNEKYKDNFNYCDDYLKVHFITKQKPELNQQSTLFIGHDLWTDAYYISKYTNANVVLINLTLSYNNKPHIKDINTLHVIEPNFNNLKDYLVNKKEFDYRALHEFARKMLHDQIMGSLNLGNIDFSKVIKKKEWYGFY